MYWLLKDLKISSAALYLRPYVSFDTFMSHYDMKYSIIVFMYLLTVRILYASVTDLHIFFFCVCVLYRHGHPNLEF